MLYVIRLSAWPEVLTSLGQVLAKQFNFHKLPCTHVCRGTSDALLGSIGNAKSVRLLLRSKFNFKSKVRKSEVSTQPCGTMLHELLPYSSSSV